MLKCTPSQFVRRCAAAASLLFAHGALADALPSCYAESYLAEPERGPARNLYLFVDQTTPLTAAMKTKIAELVADWGRNGERVKVVRFSANVRGQYSEMMFDEFADPPPTQEYLYHVHPDHKPRLLECLTSRDQQFRKRLQGVVARVVNLTNKDLPKTDLLNSLKELAAKVIAPDAGSDQTVLLVSDGMENSAFMSFYQRKTIVKPMDPHKTLTEIGKANLIPSWHGAKIYMYGLGFVPDEKVYAHAKMLQPLKEFWTSYFNLGKAQLMELGTPELMMTSLK
jgi:hypothetical protein